MSELSLDRFTKLLGFAHEMMENHRNADIATAARAMKKSDVLAFFKEVEDDINDDVARGREAAAAEGGELGPAPEPFSLSLTERQCILLIVAAMHKEVREVTWAADTRARERMQDMYRVAATLDPNPRQKKPKPSSASGGPAPMTQFDIDDAIARAQNVTRLGDRRAAVNLGEREDAGPDGAA